MHTYTWHMNRNSPLLKYKVNAVGHILGCRCLQYARSEMCTNNYKEHCATKEVHVALYELCMYVGV